MLIYPLHCRLPPPSFKMWLFSDGQGNFDPLRLLWSETPFNRSSMQEFKLILSLRPQPLCWDAQSKLKLFEAARVADSQQSWKHFLMLTFSASDLLLMGCTPIFFQCVYVEGDVCLILKNSSFFISFQENYAVCKLPCLCLYFRFFLSFFSETDWHPALCGSPFKVSPTMILVALFLDSESVRLHSGTPQ